VVDSVPVAVSVVVSVLTRPSTRAAWALFRRRTRGDRVGGCCDDDAMASVLDGLDPQQTAAVLAPRGPVCVLAGAGTGKTRTITHRIAHLVEGGHVAAGQVLAVTFTARAAGEMRSRLRSLGVGGGTGGGAVQARTFH